jgi:hypothetical protein
MKPDYRADTGRSNIPRQFQQALVYAAKQFDPSEGGLK